MNPSILNASYSLPLVALSFAVSMIGSYTALSVAGAARRGDRKVNRFDILMAGLALGGIAIWATHFIGMAAWSVDLRVGYQLLTTLVSLAAAVLVSTLALGYVAAGPLSAGRLLLAGSVAGVGVAAMHYLGMASMTFGGFFDWNLPLVGLSLGIAVVAATAALWLAFNTQRRSHRLFASAIMAGAVCAMHYTGMAAASVVCTARDRLLPFDLLRPVDMPMVVLAVSLGVVAVITLDQLLQRVLVDGAVPTKPIAGAGVSARRAQAMR
jgi:NO-binding membrane sensor protein with MHYT domain